MTDQAFPFVNPRGWRDRAARAAARKLYDVTRVDVRGQRAAQVERQRLTAVLVDAENEAPRHIDIVQRRDTSHEAKVIAQRRLEELGERATEAAERLAQLDGPAADDAETPDPLAVANTQLDATAPQPEAQPPQAQPPQTEPPQAEPPETQPPQTEPAPVTAGVSVQQPAADASSTGEAQPTGDAGQSADASVADPAATQDAAATQALATGTKPKTKSKTK
jgi:hypothetical protein